MLVVDAVQGCVHAQVELVALAVAAHLQAITHRAHLTQPQLRVTHGGKAAAIVYGDHAFEDGMAIGDETSSGWSTPRP